MESNKESYEYFIKNRDDISLFQQVYWLDSVCGVNNWNVILHKDKGGEINAFMTYYLRKYKGQTIIKLPPLTPYMGIWIEAKFLTKNNRTSYNNISKYLIDRIPKNIWINLPQNPAYYNWLPYYWENYQGTVMYSYTISKENNINDLKLTLKKSLRKVINRANARLKLIKNDNILEYYKLLEKSFSKNNSTVPFTSNKLDEIYSSLKKNNAGQLFFALDEKNRINGGILLGIDKQNVYVIGFGKDYDIAHSETSEFLQWKSMEFAINEGKDFDFNGSMIKGINSMITSFPVDQQLYYRIFKGKNKLINVLNLLR